VRLGGKTLRLSALSGFVAQIRAAAVAGSDVSETSWGRRKYRTTNRKAYKAALKARGDLRVWLEKDMQWLDPASGKRGRSQTFSDAVIQFCLTIKCLFGLPLRQTLGLVQSLLKIAGLPWAAPDYSTVCRRQKGLDVQVHYRRSGNGLHMLADSTGIKFLGEGEWKTKKHGAERRRQWCKGHVGIDAENLQIRAMVVPADEQFTILHTVGNAHTAMALRQDVVQLLNAIGIWGAAGSEAVVQEGMQQYFLPTCSRAWSMDG